MRLEDEHFTKHQLIAYAVIALETIQRSANTDNNKITYSCGGSKKSK